MSKNESVDAASMQPIVMRLRERCTGYKIFRVQDKDTKAWVIQWPSWEEREANEYWERERNHEWNANRELVSIQVESSEEKVMQEAADMLEFFFGQMQMHSPKMDGQHSYRFKGGWPMTHCVGPNAEDAVRAAIQEIQRSRSESA